MLIILNNIKKLKTKIILSNQFLGKGNIYNYTNGMFQWNKLKMAPVE